MSRTYELVKYSVTPKLCAELASKTRVKSRGMLSLLKKFQTLENPSWETDLMRLRPECDGGGADLDEGETVGCCLYLKFDLNFKHIKSCA